MAGLQLRKDRKYVIGVEYFDQLCKDFPEGVFALNIDGRHDFRYESCYFDTPNLLAYRAAAHSRRRRFKVRFRHYLDTNDHMLEVKLRTARGQSQKIRIPVDESEADLRSLERRSFVDEATDSSIASGLEPVLTTQYRRSTLVDPTGASRLTIDREVTCMDVTGRSISLNGLVIESKTVGPPSRFDRWLWTHGVRPVRLSKYCTGLAALRPDLPSNKWHRTLQHYME
ncbi:MAG: VTC domain-containing protein [Acidimicrobiales bacterium]|nr:VTC domain-containing protein [Acidimicrobiales bacterium]